MACEAINAELMRRFDEGALEGLPVQMMSHIESCPKCRKDLEALIRLQRGLDELQTPEPDPDYWNNFLPKLRQRMEKRPFSVRTKDTAWVPALGMAILFAVVLLTSPARITPPTWYVSQSQAELEWNQTGLRDDGLTAQEWKKLSLISDEHKLLSSFVDSTEVHLIEQLSEPSVRAPEDPIDRLAQMGDDDLETFLNRLRACPIIRS